MEADACLRFVQEGSAPQLISQIRSVSDVTFVFRFMSAAQRISIAPYLYILYDVFQDVLSCPDFIIANLDILFALTHAHESIGWLELVVSRLSLEQRSVVSHLLSLDQSPSPIRCSRDFIRLANYFSTEQRAPVFERVQEKLLGDIQSSYDFSHLLKYLNTEQRAFVFECLQVKLLDMIQSSDNFSCVLKYLNTEQRTALCLAMKNKWTDIIKYPHDLRVALSHLNLEQYAIIFAAMKDLPSIHTQTILAIHRYSGENVLKSFSKEQCAVFCSVLKDKLLDIFYSGDSIQQVLSALEPEQYAIMCSALKDTLLISRHKKRILYIVNAFDKKNRLAFWDILIKILPDIVVSDSELADILSCYNSAEQQTIILVTSLTAYRTRIAQHTTRAGTIDYQYGFWHHKQSRAINREGNALLAKKMAEMLASTGSLDGIYGTYDGVITSKETHSFREALLIYRKALMYSDEAQLKNKPYFARAIERQINSAELNSIIDKWSSFELGTKLGV